MEPITVCNRGAGCPECDGVGVHIDLAALRSIRGSDADVELSILDKGLLPAILAYVLRRI